MKEGVDYRRDIEKVRNYSPVKVEFFPSVQYLFNINPTEGRTSKYIHLDSQPTADLFYLET